MLLIFKKVYFLVGLTLFVISAHSQIVYSTRNGVWSDPTTWVGGVVPTSVNATQIIIDHNVELPDAYPVSVFRLVVNNTLTLKTGATLEILTDALPNEPDLQVFGTLISEDNAVLTGTSSSNTVFESGAQYVHQQGPLGYIPYAVWDKNATFIIAGFTTSGYINIAHSDSWKQTFGNVVYDCPEQTIFVVDLNGYLRNIEGNFTIKNTNNQTLRLSTTQNPVINIGGDFSVEGPAEVWFSTNGTAAVVNIQGDFIYNSTSSGPSYFATRGITAVNVLGNMELDSPGPIRMTSSSADSLGLRLATLSLSGDLRIASGTIIAPPLGSGAGKIIFNGTGVQSVVTPSAGGSFQGNLDYIIESNAIVDLGTSVLSNTSGMLQVKGRLSLGSSHPLGAIQLESNGNIHVQGTRIFENGSSIEYNGSGPQFIGNGHPSSMGVNLICNNQTDITLLQDVTVGGDFYQMVGSLHATPFALNIYGDLTLQEGVLFQAEIIRLLGNQNQEVSAAGTGFNDLHINKSGNANVKILSPLAVEGVVLIESENTILDANGYLTLLSTTDQASGNACIGPIPNGSGVIGNVTVQRYMSGEGRIYRYISSPVQNATVAALMDDFPVTGSFGDPSTGIGIDSNSPSFFFYDESGGGLQEGWIPYPTVGLAGTNPLEAGRGYAAFIRKGTGATIWDVSGNLNQGEISLPVTYSPGGGLSNGWNLVGNPYACTIDWDVSGADGWTKQHISNVIAIRDNGIGGVFHYWDGDVNYADIPNGQIAAGQSMWVRATDVDPVLIIREGTKVTNGAAFYRVSPAYIPSLALTLKKGILEDKAYVKVREKASPGLDDWDALKMENDNFSVSILSGDSIPMAIDARNKLPCNAETISLVLSDLTTGTYSFSLGTKFDFVNFTYTLIDHYLNLETVLPVGREVEFAVTKVPASFARDRFALRLDEIMPDSTRNVTAPAVVCSEEVIPVLIENAQAGIHYTVWTKNGRQLSGEWIGDDADLRIEVPADSLQPGEHTLVVSARNMCKQELLSATITTKKENVILLSAIGGTGCAGSAVTLTASSDTDDLTYSWFEARDALDTLARGDHWVTPPITKRKTYFVSGLSPAGCASERYPVVAEIIPFDSAKITWVGAAVLSSNYVMGNEWYHDGQILPDEVDRQIELKAPGKYSLRVAVNGCVTSDSVEFTIAGLNHAAPLPINLFPNPVKDRLIIEGTDGDVEMVEIINAMGIAVDRFNADDMKDGKGTIVINTSGLASGVYLAVIKCKSVSQVIRFIKLR